MSNRKFPGHDELQVLQFLKDNTDIENNKGVAYPLGLQYIGGGEYSQVGSWGKFLGFTGIPMGKVLQSPHSLEEYNLEGLYSLLNYTDAKYIILAKEDIEKS